MMKSLLFALLFTAGVARYQHYELVVRDPKEFDLLYSSTSGPVNETWYFGEVASLTSIKIPAQINLCSSDPSTIATYEEAIDLLVYETRNGYDGDDTYLVATGSFSGIVSFGQDLDISLWNATLNNAPTVQEYYYSTGGYEYTLNIVFRKNGTYPWYTVRNLSDFSVVDSRMAGSGIAIGLSFSLI